MRTIRHNQPGYFPTPPGMCFTKPDLPLPDGTHLNVANRHPFVIINEMDDAVECVMARTLYCEREGKDLRHKLRYDENVEILNPHPPMESGDTRGQYVNTQGTIIVPKRILYEATDVRVCNDGGWLLDKADVQRLKSAAMYQAVHFRDSKQLDPYDYEELPYPIDEFLPRKGSNAVSTDTPEDKHEGLSQ